MSDDDYYGEEYQNNDDDGSEIYKARDEVQDDEGFQMEEQRFEATFAEMRDKQVIGEELNPRSQKDKPFIILRDELIKLLGQESRHINDTIVQLRESKLFPFLNAVYVANVKHFILSGQKPTPANISKWVTDANRQFGSEYLNLTDFYRYIKIGEKLFN